MFLYILGTMTTKDKEVSEERDKKLKEQQEEVQKEFKGFFQSLKNLQSKTDIIFKFNIAIKNEAIVLANSSR